MDSGLFKEKDFFFRDSILWNMLFDHCIHQQQLRDNSKSKSTTNYLFDNKNLKFISEEEGIFIILWNIKMVCRQKKFHQKYFWHICHLKLKSNENDNQNIPLTLLDQKNIVHLKSYYFYGTNYKDTARNIKNLPVKGLLFFTNQSSSFLPYYKINVFFYWDILTK